MADFILNMPPGFFARVFGNPAGDPVLLKSRGVTLLRDNSRAQCLAKLGRCLVKEQSFTEGKEKIRQAIDIRKARGEADIVMLGATYNDLAGG